MRIPSLPLVFVMLGCAGQSASVSGNGGVTAMGGGLGSGGSSAGAGASAGAGQTSVAGAHTGGSSGSASSVRACKDSSLTANPNGCRDVSECHLLSPVKCCTPDDCWTGAATCPIPPSMCGTYVGTSPSQCTRDSDCDGGTCTITVSGCPQCPTGRCNYPPPKCVQNPDNCGSDARCQPDGTCAPLLCNAGFACPTGSRCAVGSTRADGHGCELIPCNDGWACEENTRCTAPTDATSHGCRVVACTSDADCDCGYCVNGKCLSNLGTCKQPAV